MPVIIPTLFIYFLTNLLKSVKFDSYYCIFRKFRVVKDKILPNINTKILNTE